jgi:ribonuclease BN (tRNA processing enzyme)
VSRSGGGGSNAREEGADDGGPGEGEDGGGVGNEGRREGGGEGVGLEGEESGGLLAKELKIRLSTVAVRHSCRDACGVIVENLSSPPWKIVYSGDTRPCQALEAAGSDATLLLHEATFESSLDSEARFKQHSTTAEALGVGRNMGAYRVVLTHFSQRYAKVPVIKDVAEDGRAMFAFDLMAVDLSELASILKTPQ